MHTGVLARLMPMPTLRDLLNRGDKASHQYNNRREGEQAAKAAAVLEGHESGSCGWSYIFQDDRKVGGPISVRIS